MVRTVSPAELKRMVDDPEPVLLLDVRRRPAFEADGDIIPGAVWKDPADMDTWARDLPSTVPIVVYCVSGHWVSNGVVDHLRALGHHARLVEGGIEAWKAAGGTVVAHSPAARTEGGSR